MQNEHKSGLGFFNLEYKYGKQGDLKSEFAGRTQDLKSLRIVSKFQDDHCKSCPSVSRIADVHLVSSILYGVST